MSTRKSVLPLVSAAALLLVPLAAQEPQRFRTGVNTVPVYVTVTDRDGRIVPDLIQEDFEVYDNGQRQEITSFENAALPITVIVMIDTSGSMTLALDFVKEGAEQFLIRMLPDDRAMVGAFNDKIQFIPSDDFTGDRDFLIRSLRDLDFGYPTRLWDAVSESIDKLDGVQGRKVVLMFTDGDDTASRGNSSGRMVEKARGHDVMIYGIGLENRYMSGGRQVTSRPDRGLRRLVEETGGGYFELKRTDELNATFTRVAQELRSQYVLGFTPENLDGKVHKLEVRVKRPGAIPRARRSYVAAPPGT
jgi:Ca-activated chloride channel homolog